MDVFVWLSRGEGMPHVIAEAGAAGLPVIATADNGSMQQIEDGVSGLFVPHETPAAVAAAIERLASDRALRAQLGSALRRKVETSYSAAVVTPQWEALFRAVLAERQPAPPPALFASFIQGGFECSTHRLRDGRRLDLLEATHHATNAAGDYAQLAGHGIRAVRDGLRWHLIETSAGPLRLVELPADAARGAASGTQVIWDLMHYGWPDDLDIWSPAFVDRFAAFAAAAARVVRSDIRRRALLLPGQRDVVPLLGRRRRRLPQPLRPAPRLRAEGAARPRLDRRHARHARRRPARPLRPLRAADQHRLPSRIARMIACMPRARAWRNSRPAT